MTETDLEKISRARAGWYTPTDDDTPRPPEGEPCPLASPMSRRTLPVVIHDSRPR